MRTRLRRADLRDAPALVALERNFPTDRFTPRAVRYLLRTPNAAVFVAERNRRVAGAAVLLTRANSALARLYSIAVSRDVRGRGLGAALLRAVEAEARRRGRRAMSLEVRQRNRAARALYERLGYAPVRRLPRYYEDGADALRLRKALVRGAAAAAGPRRPRAAPGSRRARRAPR